MIKLTQQFPTNPEMQLWQTRDLHDAPVVQELLHRFPHDILHVQNTRMGIPVVWIKRETLLNAIRFLRHAPKPFVMLYDLHATDERLRTHRHGLPASEFTMFYHLLSIERNSDVILKIPLMESDLKMPSITGEFPNANWYEREVWDMLGIHFDGHPHLIRILMPRNWTGHPLRKEYPARATEFEPFMLDEMRQDEDALDTWFSSWLWPISVFDGINNPENEEINYYYPTSDLVTGPDIIFFWVARMIMAGYEYKGDMPFKNVYFTGIVRDKLGRKMSKSLGNSPDPLELIDKYGADGVRMGMMLAAPAGNDILFDDALCEQGRNFNNKIWNAFRLVKGWEVADIAQPEYARLATEWFESMLAKTAAEVADLFGKYRLSEALMAVYKLFWDEFSSWYLEMIKPAYGQPIDKATYEKTLGFFDNLLKLLHPFMPFITEELWQHIYDRKEGESLMVQQLNIPTACNEIIVKEFEVVKEVIGGIRTIRLQKNIAQKETLELQVVGVNPVATFNPVITKLCNLSSIEAVENKADGSGSFMVGTTEYAIPLGNLINTEEELAKLEADLKYQEGFLQSVLKKLSNEKFVSKAPANVIDMERKKQADAESKIASLKESIAALKK